VRDERAPLSSQPIVEMKSAVFLVASAATAMSSPSFGSPSQPYELPSLMVVSKSGNRNELHYAAYVDEKCSPVTNTPVHAYWVMLERGPGVTEVLSRAEVRVLGIASQEVSGDTIRFVVNGMPSRTFVAHTGRGVDGACSSWVETTIGGAQARLLSVYVKQRLFGVDYVLLTGRTPEGKAVQERLVP
jgi:hypothetical protein